MAYKIPIKGGGSLDVETIKDLPDNVYQALVVAGLKDLLNRGMTKIGKLKVSADTTEADVEAAKAKAMEIAAANLAKLVAGKLPRMAGLKAASGKVPGVVMTEARRLARNVIKDEIKKAGEKISHYDAKDITAMANELLGADEGKELLATAQANVDARAKLVEDKPVSSFAELRTKLGISVSATKVEAAAKKKAAAKEASPGVLSAAKAGVMKTRSAPKGATVN